MSRKSFAGAVGRALKPMGFTREGSVCSRTVGTVLEQVEIQTSWLGGATANLYSKDLATEALLREAIPWDSSMALEGMRIGELMPGRLDRWWKHDPENPAVDGPGELAEAVVTYAPAWFEQRRSIDAQLKMFGRGAERLGSSYNCIYLALTLYRIGETEEACRAIASPYGWLLKHRMREVESLRRWLKSHSEGSTGEPTTTS